MESFKPGAPVCEICGRVRNPNINHRKCSKQLQAKYKAYNETRQRSYIKSK